MNHTNTEKVKSIVELSYVLDGNLQQEKSLLDVALDTDITVLQPLTQHDYLSVLDDKIVVAMQAHNKIISLCNNGNDCNTTQ